MPNVVVADTSCLIILEKINHLHLLQQLYGKISVTDEIAREFAAELESWIYIKNPKNKALQNQLEVNIGLGEASAIALALEEKDALLILDDDKARKTAKQFKLKYTGTIGVIVKAKKQSHISSIKPLLEKIKKTNFRISNKLEKIALEEAGETK